MYRIGVDLGGTKTAAALIDRENRIVFKRSLPTYTERGNDAVSEGIAELVKSLIADAECSLDDIEMLGIATPGAINGDTGYVERACNLLMEHYPLVDTLKKMAGINNIKIENDANAAALGEAIAGSAKGTKFSVMITLGTGVGGGFVIDGKVYSGFNFTGGEFGHMVIEHGGRRCNCGRYGCWEAYSSATALITMTKEAMEKNPASAMHAVAEKAGKVSGKTAFDAAKLGDAPAQAVVDTYISYLACGVVNVINLLQPDILCIGGGISNEGKGLIDPLVTAISKEIFTPPTIKSTEIRIASLGNDAGLIGAANL